MKVTVFGIGYVGLVQAAVLAEVGHDVFCVDINAEKIEALRAGNIPIFEPDLDVLVERNVNEGRLHFTTDAKSGVEHASIQFIAVGTPPDEDGSADLKYVTAVARTIAQYMMGPADHRQQIHGAGRHRRHGARGRGQGARRGG